MLCVETYVSFPANINDVVLLLVSCFRQEDEHLAVDRLDFFSLFLSLALSNRSHPRVSSASRRRRTPGRGKRRRDSTSPIGGSRNLLLTRQRKSR